MVQAAHLVPVESRRFPDLKVPETDILHLVSPLPGFPQTHRLAALQLPSQGPFIWLQSMEEPQVAFTALNPTHWFEDWSLGLSETDRQLISLAEGQQPRALCLCSFQPAPNANLAAPLIINPESRAAVQAIDTHADYPLAQPLFGGASCSS